MNPHGLPRRDLTPVNAQRAVANGRQASVDGLGWLPLAGFRYDRGRFGDDGPRHIRATLHRPRAPRRFEPMASDTTTSALMAQVLAARRLGTEGRLRVTAELSEDSQANINRRRAPTNALVFVRGRTQASSPPPLGRRARLTRLARQQSMSDLRDLLERIVPALQQAGVPFMVAGSFASTAHGLPRATRISISSLLRLDSRWMRCSAS